ncbi:MAG: ATP synthase F1 subunit epsilon [Firmicutes bacterium]|jgi:F-type H+-transporting ATPase subunit epsilon|nr:ATP synthase F1 subunit epsilon [Bacillota bacterium]
MADYPLTVVTPEGVVYEGPVTEIILRGSEGDLGVLAHHMPLVTAVLPCVLHVVETDGTRRRFALGGGFLEVGREETVVLADTAEPSEQINRSRAEDARRRAQERIDRGGVDLDLARARAALARAEARLGALDGE